MYLRSWLLLARLPEVLPRAANEVGVLATQDCGQPPTRQYAGTRSPEKELPGHCDLGVRTEGCRPQSGVPQNQGRTHQATCRLTKLSVSRAPKCFFHARRPHQIPWAVGRLIFEGYFASPGRWHRITLREPQSEFVICKTMGVTFPPVAGSCPAGNGANTRIE